MDYSQVELLVPQDAVHGQALWLQVQVGDQVLAPRQELLPVPYALSLKPGAQIYGPSESALYLGSGSEVAPGVKGESGGAHGVEGVTNSYGFSHAGVYGRNDGLGPAIWSQGDLYVTGAYRGSLPNEGGSFPRPAYDSGVQCMETSHCMDLDPGLPKPAYNPYNFVIDFATAGEWGVVGSRCVGPRDGYNWNIWDNDLNTIHVWRSTEELCPPCFRLRVWYMR